MASAADVLRFRTEAEAAANLDHPNIVPIYEIGEHDGQQYFSMKLIGPGVRDQGSGVRETVRVMILVARAVHHAHQRGILHRDLKPGNILFDEHGDPHVADFGLAKRVGGEGESGMTRSGAIVGTPSYMAPEQARAEKVLTTAVDVYSLGAILYEWLTGRPPFRGDDVLATLQMVANDEPPRPRSLNPGIDRDLETICLKCLQKDADRRYGSAEMLAEDLQRWQSGEPILARPAGVAEKISKWVRRRPVVAGLSAAVVLISVVGIAAFAWSFDQTVQALAETEEARKQADADRKQADEDRKEAVAAKKKADDEKNLADIATEFAKQETKRAASEKLSADLAKKKAEESEVNANWRLYALQIASALREWETNNAASAFRNLNPCRKELRGWEHDYLYTLTNKHQQTLHGHTKGVRYAAFSSDGKTILSRTWDQELKLWDAESGKEIRTSKGHSGQTCAALSGDGKKMVVGISEWSSSFSERAIRLFGGSTLKVYDTQSGKEILTLRGNTSLVGCVAFSPDGTMILSSSSNSGGALGVIVAPTLKLWDAASGRPIRTLIHDDDSFPSTINCLAFSPDGKRVVSNQDYDLRVWDTDTGKETAFLAKAGNRPGQALRYDIVASVAFSPDGKKIVSGHRDNSLTLWNADNGKEIFTLKGHTNQVLCVNFSQDGRKIASGSWDTLVKVWDVDDGKELLTLKGHLDAVLSVAFSPDGKKIVSGGHDNTVKVWFPLLSQETLTVKGDAFSRDGTKALSRGGENKPFQVRDALTGLESATLKMSAGNEDFRQVANLRFSPDGKRIVGSLNVAYPRLIVWNAETGEVIRAGKDPVNVLAFSTDSKRILTILETGPGELCVRDLENGQPVSRLKGHVDDILCAAFSPDGKWIATGGLDNVARLWDVERGREIRTLKSPKGKGVFCVTFSPDGKKILTGSSGENTIKVWHAESGQEIQTLIGHTGFAMAANFSPDGKRLVTGSMDRTLKLWDVERGEEILTLRGHTDAVTSAAFSPDGKMIISTSRDGTLKIWDASQTQP